MAEGAKSWLLVLSNPLITVVQLVSGTLHKNPETNACVFSVSRFADVCPQQSLCGVPFAVELGLCGRGHHAAGCRNILPHFASYLQDGL
ncbi:hypothetical protein Cfor_11428 [Coptotermes formosanus]|jgi:hypothetical protein|uniref:Secreted protein n=1 Tax=Coptotermes formosanus TaxID=36987 RepID=A0A6L2PEZ7_COPFO|nr:hypothetical protein Cfor_11428 [Coptotermes formosanus]